MNTTGKVPRKPIVDTTEGEYDSTFDTNVKAAYSFIQERILPVGWWITERATVSNDGNTSRRTLALISREEEKIAMSTPSTPEPVASFLERVNAHDEQAFLDAFTADGVVDDWGRTVAGREAIKAWSDKEFIGSRGVLTVEEVDAAGDTVTVIGDWRSNHANGRSKFVFDIAGDKLAKMTISEG